MSHAREERVLEILQKRLPLAERISNVDEHLGVLERELRALDEVRRTLVPTAPSDVSGRLRDIDLAGPLAAISAHRAAAAKLNARFRRQTLNIGVIGRARQGKSRLLQSLTGLTAAEIPDGDRMHCTGVRSTIHHNGEVERHAEVWFHSERSLLDEVLAPYYEHLRLGPTPTTLDDFEQRSLPPLPTDLPGHAQPKARYERLTFYHRELRHVRELLRAPSPRSIAFEDIRAYVAQDDATGQRAYRNYLAVRQVKIVCKFPSRGIQKVAVVDMPGLGDTGLGDAERLVRTLSEDVDLVLFVRMPKPSGDHWAEVDTQLYDTARTAVPELPLSRWSFMVLNQTDRESKYGDNANNCSDLASGIEREHMDVVSAMIVNCADPGAVQSQVLDTALEYLGNHVLELDRDYAVTCQERLLRLQAETANELDKARRALGDSVGGDKEFAVFRRLSSKWWKDITTALEGLLRTLRGRRGEQDPDLREHVQAAIRRCRADTGLPDSSAIAARRDEFGSFEIAYRTYLHEIRTRLSQHFLSLDSGLKRHLELVKAAVAQVLTNRASLRDVAAGDGSEYLRAFATALPATLPQLRQAFDILSSFELSYRGLIQHRIRTQLDDLTPDETNLQLSRAATPGEVATNLQVLHQEAVYRCEQALEQLLAEPSQAAFAIVEEFVDRVLRAEGVREEWDNFLYEMRAHIWGSEFDELGARSRLRRTWHAAVDKACAANDSSLLKFL